MTGPGPRTVIQPRDPGRAASQVLPAVRRVRLSALAALAVLMAAACGSAGPSSVSVPSASAPIVGPVVPASGAPPESLAPGATPARWPGTTVLATIALGAADGEIQKAGADLQAAADRQDLKAMWGAADGLAKMIDGLTPNIARLEIYPETQPAARIYRVAFPEIAAAAKQLRDAITSGDAAGVVAGSQALAKGLADYGPVRPIIGGLVEQAIVQQRLLLQ